MNPIEPVPLHEAARERYLSYALSVITSRALPDVRDGLKPVQRRILYTMYNELSLHPTGRYRKCAAVVGEVMGKFHPHGDQSIYEALVRMAQDFSLRHPLVDGQGNFGSLDGDPAAAMRYTECRLREIAEELLTEIGKRTVDFRPSYDGQRFEPIVLPAQFPQVLVNGSEGIAVGMATRIPPHNLGEVCDAAIALSKDRSLSSEALAAFVKGPDFPTGGRLLASPDELREIYATGQGTVRLRATWDIEKDGRKRQIVISSIPYGTNKAKLLERIGAEVVGKKLPQVLDARDESTEVVRIVLDLKQDASADAAMAYLFKHTPLETTWPINLTCLVPIPKEHVGEDAWDAAAPARLSLAEILGHWLDFRFETVRRRYEFDLDELRERIHVLEGLARIFDALDEAVAIIRKSQSKRDAAERLMERFRLDEIQVEAILQLRLYKLAALERDEILEELREKRARADEYTQILGSNDLLWERVRTELTALRDAYAEPRRTVVGGPERELTYEEDAYIVKEDAFVVVSRDGWIKRQSTFSDMGRIRIRDEDEIGWLVKAHTRSTLTFFTSTGTAYVLRVDDVPATSGYGEPLQARFNFADGERVVGVVSHDARHRPILQEALPLVGTDEPPPPWAIALTAKGRVLRFPLAPHEEVSNRSGRMYARLDDADAVFAVWPVDGDEHACVATRRTHVLVFPVAEVPVLKAAGKGVTGIKVAKDDQVVAFEVHKSGLDGPTIVTSTGKEVVVRERTYGQGPRGGKGRALLKKGTVDAWVRAPVVKLGTPDPVDAPPTPDAPPGGPAEA